jgi:energy-coupling factor transporter transmembrane protein EcfT
MSPLELLIFLFIFVLPIGFAIACARIAKRKGYSEVGFGLLGFFLSIFALILVLVLPDRRKPRDASEMSEQDAQADS